MLISIIVPVYNVRDYLPRCLDSILANELSDCEIILVDDGSTDDSGAICDRYAAEHSDLIRVIHQQNGGLGAARNTGIEAAAGTWFLFVDSDDRIAPTALARLKQAVASGAQMICFQYYSDNVTDPPVPCSNGFAPELTAFTLAQRPEFLLSLPSAWMRLWKRELFLRSGIRFPARVWYEDISVFARLAPQTEGIVNLPEHLYYYLNRPGSIMNSAKLPRNREIITAFSVILDWYRKSGLFAQYSSELCALTVQHVLLAASVRVARIDPNAALLRELRDYTDNEFPDWQNNRYLKTLPRGKRLALTLVRLRRFRLLRLLFRLKG